MFCFSAVYEVLYIWMSKMITSTNLLMMSSTNILCWSQISISHSGSDFWY